MNMLRWGMGLPQFRPGEFIVHDGAANHWRRGRSIGGRLWLTTAGLLFRSHVGNEYRIELAQIKAVWPVRSLYIVPNGLIVATTDGAQQRFVVWKHRAWAERIATAAGCQTLPIAVVVKS